MAEHSSQILAIEEKAATLGSPLLGLQIYDRLTFFVCNGSLVRVQLCMFHLSSGTRLI